MTGFFDFIKKSNSNASAPPTTGLPTPVATTTSPIEETHSAVAVPSGTPYNGIGAPSHGQSYNGIGAPPVPSVPEVNETVVKPPQLSDMPKEEKSDIKPTDSPTQGQVPLSQTKTGTATSPKPQNQSNTNDVSSKSSPTTQGLTGKSLSSTLDEKKREELDLMTHLTQRSNRVFLSAQTKAKELENQFIDSEHLLHGLLADGEIYKLLSELKIQSQLIEQELLKLYKKEVYKDGPPQMSPRVKRIIDNSLIVARKLGFEFISPEHILLSLFEEGEGVGARVLSQLGLKKEDLNKKIVGKKEGLSLDGTVTGKENPQKKSALEQYTIDMTARAAQGLLDPVVERYETIERVIHILSRRSKNNPALVGEAGVGKTAVVEGLAEKIVAKQVPDTLLNKRILSLDLMSILAGASHRGEFEERMKDLLEEVKASKGQIILFIDEIHNIMGAGGGEGSSDAANFLKPSLSRGEMQLIGATTLTEYRKHIEKDPALERRFQPVVVPEPTEEQAAKMLKAIKGKYEAFHRVQIPDEAIDAAVKFSKRYVGDRFLPDKAIDLIDEAASAVRLPLISLPEAIQSIQERISKLTQEIQEAEKSGDKVKARIIRSRLSDIQADLHEKQDEYNIKKAQTTTSVSVEIIKDIVSRWTGVPVSKITGSEMDRLANLEKIMHERVIGQEDAVTSVAQAVRRGRAGLKSTERPIGSFVFLGPTGTGKTELAKTLADVLFGQEDAMIRFDMTEFMEKHEVAKLLGAPPGYVGYEEGGKLTEAVRRKPYSVVLFDEVEKAHPDIFNILLQILDDGRLTDNKGHTISFKNTVIICTSNIGSKIIQAELMKSGKAQVEEPNVLSTYTYSPNGREILTIGNKYFQRTQQFVDVPVEKQVEPVKKEAFSTLCFTPRGRQIMTLKDQYFEREVIPGEWKKSTLTDYFNGQKIENDENQKQEILNFPVDMLDTHAISSEGVEMMSKGETLYYRTSTTAKVWKKSTLIDYVKDNVVINALPDAPDQQLPTGSLQTHSFSPDEKEVLTLGNRFWRRKESSNDWETGLIKNYFVNQTVKEGAFPSDHWNVHTFSPTGDEFISVDNIVYIRKADATIWESKTIDDYLGKENPIKSEEHKDVAEKTSLPKATQEEVNKTWKEGILLDYFAGQEVEKETIDDGNIEEKKLEFPFFGFDTHAISKKGMEIITKGNNVFFHSSTTEKMWKMTKLIHLFQKNVVINAIPDATDEQLPTAALKTHSFDMQDREIVTYKDRFWRKKEKLNEWETGLLKDYFTDQIIEKGNFPTTYWDVHCFSPSGLEIIIVGEVVWYHQINESKWMMKRLDEYFGNDFPLRQQVDEKLKIDDEIEKKKFGVLKSKVMEELHKFFRPELINRFDETIIFEPLRFIHMKSIVKIQLKSVQKAMEDQDMGFSCTEAAIKEIVRSGFDPVFGARPLRRAIQKLVENPLSSLIIEKKVKPGNSVLVDFDGQDFVFNVEKTEITTGTDNKSLEKKKYLCESCANKFMTEIIPNSTLICSKCASHTVSEVFEEGSGISQKKEEQREETKKPDSKSDTLPSSIDQPLQQTVAG